MIFPIENMAFPSSHGFMYPIHHEGLDINNDHHLPSPISLNSLPSCPPPFFHGGGGGGGGVGGFMMKRSMSFSGVDKSEDILLHGGGDDDLSDDGSHIGEKKKRLNLEQVKALEKSFEIGNKLDPERKNQLAKALGLQPRQIAIWFQNRRARWKTKQLERDYDVLKKQFESLKADNDSLQAQNKKLNSELLALKKKDCNDINIKKETEAGSWSNNNNNGGGGGGGCSENSNSDQLNLDISARSTQVSPVSSSQLTSKHLFPNPPLMVRPYNNNNNNNNNNTSMSTQALLQGPSRILPDLHSLKVDHQMVHQEESFCNMFNGIDEQQASFWAWHDQQQQQHQHQHQQQQQHFHG